MSRINKIRQTQLAAKGLFKSEKSEPASSGNSELLCVCQGGWMCPNCRDKLEFENHEMKRRIDEACRMMREGDFSLEMSAVGDEFLMMVSQQIQAIKHT